MQGAEGLQRARHHHFAVAGVGDVGSDVFSLRACLAQRLSFGCDLGPVTIGEHDAGALRSEGAGGRKADAARSPGHQHDPVLEPVHRDLPAQ